jgi:hypothetical protein
MRLKVKDVALGAAVAGTVLTSAAVAGGGLRCAGTCGACGFTCLLPLAGLATAGGIGLIPVLKKRLSGGRKQK